MARPSEVAVARLIGPHGLRGEVEAKILGDSPERITPGRRFCLSPETTGSRELVVEGVRSKKDRLLLKFAGIEDRDAAASIRGLLLTVPLSELPTLEENKYYHFDLIGLRVVTADGGELGTVEEIIETGANDVYVVRGAGKEVLIPAIKSVVVDIDLARGRMTVEPMPGLIPGESDED